MFGLRILAVLGALVCSGSAQASVIGFDEFNNFRQPVYTGHSEDGFDVKATKGLWREAYYFGTPFPSVFSRSGSGKLVIRAEDRGGFFASSLSIGNGGLYSGFVRYTIRGVMNGAEAFRIKGTVTSLAAFEDIMLDPSFEIDKLVISIDGREAKSFNVDNIAVAPANVVTPVVPLPASIGFLLAGLAGLFGLARRHNRQV